MTAPAGHRVAVVVGSGGLKCAAALGAVKLLREAGIPIDVVVGASGGSFFATWIAFGAGDVAEATERFRRGWQGSFPGVRWKSLAGLVLPRFFRAELFGLLRDRRVMRSIEDWVGERSFGETRIPLHLVATDFVSGEKVVLSEGRIADAIRASVAIPFALKPWRIDGRYFFDGGASDPLPIDVAIREGCDVVIAMGFEQKSTGPARSVRDLIDQHTATTVNALIRSQFAFHALAHHAEVIPVMPEFDLPVGLDDIHLLPWLVERGAQAMAGELPYLKRLLAARIAATAGPD